MKKLLIIIGVTIGLNTSIVAGPIHKAVKSGNIEEVKSLIKIGVSVDHRDENGMTALSYAVMPSWRSYEIADLLISLGANVNAENNSGHTPIFYTDNGLDFEQPLNLLIANGANVNHQAKNGITPLMNFTTNPEALLVLIKNDAEVDIKDAQGNTAPKPGGGNGGGDETVNSRLIIKTAGPDIALATDGTLGAAELQKSNDLRSWRKLSDVPKEASEVLVTPRDSGNEFYRLRKK